MSEPTPVRAFENKDAAERATATIRDFYRTIDNPERSPEEVGTFFADTYVDHGRNPAFFPELDDAEAHVAFFRLLKRAFTDAVHDIQMIGPFRDNQIVAYWTFRAQHTGEMFGIPASGRQVQFNGIDIYTMAGNRIAEQHHVVDVASLMAQIGSRQ
ncbi:MAG: ester cyclase [Pseudomonadota bacterium]